MHRHAFIFWFLDIHTHLEIRRYITSYRLYREIYDGTDVWPPPPPPAGYIHTRTHTHTSSSLHVSLAACSRARACARSRSLKCCNLSFVLNLTSDIHTRVSMYRCTLSMYNEQSYTHASPSHTVLLPLACAPADLPPSLSPTLSLSLSLSHTHTHTRTHSLYNKWRGMSLTTRKLYLLCLSPSLFLCVSLYIFLSLSLC